MSGLSVKATEILNRLPADGSSIKYWDWRRAQEPYFTNHFKALRRRGMVKEVWDANLGSWMCRRIYQDANHHGARP